MNSRFQSRPANQKSRTSKQAHAYENLEPRNLLAAMLDSTVAVPAAGTSSLVYQVTDSQPVENRIQLLRSHLDLGSNEGLDLISLERDEYGFAHFKYQQLLNNVAVEGSVYSVHVRDGQIVSMSGDSKDVVNNVAIEATLTEHDALESALAHVGAETYMWNVNTLDADGNHRYHNDDAALHELPEGELIYFTDTEGDVSLTYKFDVYSVKPFARAYIYVDANNGEIRGEMDRIRNLDTPASGTSLYNGEVNFTGDTNGGSVRLRSTLIGVETLDLNEDFFEGNAVDFVSADTIFDEPDNSVGVQVHWGVEQTLAYYAQFGRLSYDGLGTTLRSYVSFGPNFDLAFWDGASMFYGDGNGVTTGPYVTLDIVGHEITHGVTDTTAALVNMDEPGALSESFSDIFGEAIENFATGTNDWLLEHEVGIGSSGAVRNMADPNQFDDPDTYLGDNWHTTPDDNGGVHTNSGVQNKWFQLLTDGGSGVNDFGDAYDITGIGINESEQIAWRNLTVYMTANSGYSDAREGAIQSAIDLFGEDSQQHLSTAAAWSAVGVFGNLPNFTVINNVAQVSPNGSLVHRTTINGSHSGFADPYYGINLDPNQTLTLRVEGTGDFIPSVEVLNSRAEEIVGVNGDSNVAIIDGFDVPDGGLFVFGIQSDVEGDFSVDVWLNTNLETESLGSGETNDTLATAQNIESSAITLAGRAERLAVQGDLSADDDIAILGDDFESGSLGSQWTTSSSNLGGRIRVSDLEPANGGKFSLLMDQFNEGTPNLNEAIVTFDLSQQVDPVLSFAHAEYFDENNVLPGTFLGSVDGDGVSVSSDGITWHTILTDTDTTVGEWTTVTYDLNQVAEDFGIELNSNFQVKFQQFDNFRVGTDGRAYDDIEILVPASVADWFAFDVRNNQLSTVVASTTSPFDQGSIRVDVYNEAGDVIQMGNNGLEGVSLVSQFSGEGATYYARVAGSTAYSLIVTRGADFDIGDNDGDDGENTQILDNNEGVLGYISLQDARGAEPDNAFVEDNISNLFAGVTLSNETTGGDVFAAQANTFDAPTGSNVFAPGPFEAAGWRENINEFRADFAIPQDSVSIDFTADDESDIGRLRAYAADGSFLGELFTAELMLGDIETLTFTRDAPDISYIIATGIGGDVVPLDNLVFEGANSDPDVYSLIIFGNEPIDLSIILPGAGDGLFDNGLVADDGAALTMELIDPFGTVIATSNDAINLTATETGLYNIRITAQQNFEGEYFLYRDIGSVLDVPSGVDFGTEDSNLFEDYAIGSVDDYSVGRGHGWLESTRLRDFNGNRGSDLLRDGVVMQTGTYAIDVDNGIYAVDVHLGIVNVKADQMSIDVEGEFESFTPPRGPNIVRSFVANVTDGQLTLEFDGTAGLNRNFRLTGITLNETSARPFTSDSNEGQTLGSVDDSILASARLPQQAELSRSSFGVSAVRTQTPSLITANSLKGSEVFDRQQHDDQFAAWNLERIDSSSDVDSDLINELDLALEELLFNV